MLSDEVLLGLLPFLVLDIVAQVIILPLSPLVYEAGHEVAGWALGYRFHSCQVWPVVLVRTPRGPLLKLRGPSVQPNDARLLPTTDRGFRARHTVFVAGGPLFSVLPIIVAWQVVVRQALVRPLAVWLGMTYAAWVPAVTVSPPNDAAFDFGMTLAAVDAWLLSLAFMGLYTCVATIVPFTRRGIANDGMLILRTWRDQPDFEWREMMGGLAGYASIGVRPRDYPERVVRRALALAESSRDGYVAHSYAYSWELDRGEFEAGGEHLDQALALGTTLSLALPALSQEAAHFIARYRQDPATARTWLERGAQSQNVAFLCPRAEAAIALAEGRHDDAIAAADLGLTALLAARRTLPVESRTDEESLREMAAVARSMAVASAVR